MNINIELDLPGIIAQACAADRLQPLVDKAIADALRSAIDSATGYRSEFRKELEVQLAQAMPHGLRTSDIAKFQHVLNEAITSHVRGANEETVAAAMAKVMQSAMPSVPAVVKISELLKIARDAFSKEAHEAFYAYWEPSTYGTGGWLYLDSDENPNKRPYSQTRDREDVKYQAQHRIAVNDYGAVYALRMDGKDVTPASRPDVIGEFDTTLMAMYVGRTKVDIDMDDDDVRSAASAQYD
ncbi:hypothetical protein [Acidovorax sp. Leaf78]|uniref:hypothetical protein n=1 Tax=Acidovorax sp. Leaf78 TaxID=1736237 RepID=UPI0006FE8987|nr:hypothetical protein [Acidovorax sp. Leaf78]KQO23474.1 hypothetical protein ASF16_04745 [Acidovorax sp. Leaf78]